MEREREQAEKELLKRSCGVVQPCAWRVCHTCSLELFLNPVRSPKMTDYVEE